ncbi:MAG: cation-translocating P-type ATPase [Burkholderiaceae bacterium]|nr:cation-translocating P-type ATPase [Burkholderiaceae bacterium]
MPQPAPACCAARARQGDDSNSNHNHGDHDSAVHSGGGCEGAHAHGQQPGWTRLACALALALAAEMAHLLAEGQTLPALLPPPLARGAGMLMALAAIALAGLGTCRNGLAALRRGQLGIDALMAVAVIGAFIIGQWPEAAMVMALYAIAERIEHGATARASNAISALLRLKPDSAETLDAQGNWQNQSVEQIGAGALVRVKPGARLPLDGRVERGQSAVNQAPITGESLPVDKTAGDPVFAGSINLTGELIVRAGAAAGDSLLARIVRAVQQAQAARAPLQRQVEKFARLYTPAVFALALAVALLAPALLGWPPLAAIYKALALLVIACPCALVISTPVTVVSALTAAARRGILIKGGAALDAARRLRAIAFDKTGTLTQGAPALAHWQTRDGAADATWIARAAASLCDTSSHPVAQAIARGLYPAAASLRAQNVQALPGLGLQGMVDGQTLLLGNPRLLAERHITAPPALQQAIAWQEEQGRTVSLLASPAQGALALFAVADTLRSHAPAVIQELERLNLTCAMLSGDNAAAARAVAQQAGIAPAQTRSALLPADKQSALAELRARHGTVAMVGDGINDAPALASADLGFAMGGAGSEVAMESADIVIMNDDLRRLPATVRLARRAHAVLWQNIAFALGIKLLFLALALTGQATMWMAVFADTGASLLVTANGLRLLRKGA